jgi:hypothetical protein
MIRSHSVFISPVHQVGVDKLHHFRRRVYVFSAGFSSLRIFGVIVTASGQHPHRRNSEQADTQQLHYFLIHIRLIYIFYIIEKNFRSDRES